MTTRNPNISVLAVAFLMAAFNCTIMIGNVTSQVQEIMETTIFMTMEIKHTFTVEVNGEPVSRL